MAGFAYSATTLELHSNSSKIFTLAKQSDLIHIFSGK